ncbi:hypothetical protein LNTAR_02197 [Lentisphaera araneosa HTCC2155]|uniref:DUF1501 domain-containing protein n=1 Tax=Lentisphaera araneosa HTCC2155 TaxID=313628 RepID=A6DP49_9BACT|nr:DUF1501 domain-containing protein [Lentisphaera araneosa]EDM26581.1 hypothetical protein LNTAR_02197 [Lentisphaera araneosa HTCC2155]
MNRRNFLRDMGAGFTSLALADMMSQDGFLSSTAHAADGSAWQNPLKAKAPMFAPKAKSVIFLFMYGGPSQVDTFDYKPLLYKLDGKTIPVKTHGRGGHKNTGRVVGPKWNFKQHGQSGQWVSDLFPHLSKHVDDIAFIKSMQADSPIHGSAMLQMNSGQIISGSPTMGSWVNYGLGSVNQNLPGYVVMLDSKGGPISGAKNWTSGYMPAAYQGTMMRSKGNPILDLNPQKGMTREQQRIMLDTLKKYNSQHLADRVDNSNLAARISSYELAFNMQKHAPEAVDWQSESTATKEMYGINDNYTREYGTKCLMARRMVERGVRFIQLYSGGGHNDDNWDAHGDLVKNHTHHCRRTDMPIAALLQDLKQRGLLDETLVVWGGEFGRQPTAEYAKGTGRDHNAKGFTMWMAGGGIKGGISVGQTDELGNEAVENPYHVNSLHATILQLMGLDPNALSYFYGGLERKLVGVEHTKPIHQIMA